MNVRPKFVLFFSVELMCVYTCKLLVVALPASHHCEPGVELCAC